MKGLPQSQGSMIPAFDNSEDGTSPARYTPQGEHPRVRVGGRIHRFSHFWILAMLWVTLGALGLSGCASPRERRITTTAYCGCRSCCEWERGSWKLLKLDVWNRYVSKGARKGKPYTGKTASGTMPRVPREGLFTGDTLQRPWSIPFKLILPWNIPSRDGTIAADTNYYPFGTRMHVPGWGWGVVEDRGGAIKGPDRIDLFHRSHGEGLRWGRKKLPVTIVQK